MRIIIPQLCDKPCQEIQILNSKYVKKQGQEQKGEQKGEQEGEQEGGGNVEEEGNVIVTEEIPIEEEPNIHPDIEPVTEKSIDPVVVPFFQSIPSPDQESSPSPVQEEQKACSITMEDINESKRKEYLERCQRLVDLMISDDQQQEGEKEKGDISQFLIESLKAFMKEKIETEFGNDETMKQCVNTIFESYQTYRVNITNPDNDYVERVNILSLQCIYLITVKWLHNAYHTNYGKYVIDWDGNVENKLSLHEFIKKIEDLNPFILYFENKFFLDYVVNKTPLGKTFDFNELIDINDEYWLHYEIVKKSIYESKNKLKKYEKYFTKNNPFFSSDGSKPKTIFLIIIYDFLTLDEISEFYLNHFIPCGIINYSCIVDSLYHTPYDFTLHDVEHGMIFLSIPIFHDKIHLLKDFYAFYKDTYKNKPDKLYQLDIIFFILIHESNGEFFPVNFVNDEESKKKIDEKIANDAGMRIVDKTDLLPLIPETVYSSITEKDEREEKIYDYFYSCIDTYCDALSSFYADRNSRNVETETKGGGGGATRRRRRRKRTVKRRKYASRKRKTYKSKKQRRTRR
jgi:hypothetical protein